MSAAPFDARCPRRIARRRELRLGMVVYPFGLGLVLALGAGGFCELLLVLASW